MQVLQSLCRAGRAGPNHQSSLVGFGASLRLRTLIVPAAMYVNAASGRSKAVTVARGRSSSVDLSGQIDPLQSRGVEGVQLPNGCATRGISGIAL